MGHWLLKRWFFANQKCIQIHLVIWYHNLFEGIKYNLSVSRRKTFISRSRSWNFWFSWPISTRSNGTMPIFGCRWIVNQSVVIGDRTALPKTTPSTPSSIYCEVQRNCPESSNSRFWSRIWGLNPLIAFSNSSFWITQLELKVSIFTSVIFQFIQDREKICIGVVRVFGQGIGSTRKSPPAVLCPKILT